MNTTRLSSTSGPGMANRACLVVEEQFGKTMTLIFVKFPRVSRSFCCCCCCFSSIILSKLSGTRIV